MRGAIVPHVCGAVALGRGDIGRAWGWDGRRGRRYLLAWLGRRRFTGPNMRDAEVGRTADLAHWGFDHAVTIRWLRVTTKRLLPPLPLAAG